MWAGLPCKTIPAARQVGARVLPGKYAFSHQPARGQPHAAFEPIKVKHGKLGHGRPAGGMAGGNGCLLHPPDASFGRPPVSQPEPRPASRILHINIYDWWHLNTFAQNAPSSRPVTVRARESYRLRFEELPFPGKLQGSDLVNVSTHCSKDTENAECRVAHLWRDNRLVTGLWWSGQSPSLQPLPPHRAAASPCNVTVGPILWEGTAEFSRHLPPV